MDAPDDAAFAVNQIASMPAHRAKRRTGRRTPHSRPTTSCATTASRRTAVVEEAPLLQQHGGRTTQWFNSKENGLSQKSYGINAIF